MISVFQIFFDKKSYAFMDPAFYPYSNEYRDEFFENRIIRDVYQMNPVMKNAMTYIGVTSWKQHKKTHLSGKEILDFIQKDIDAGTGKDIYIYSPIQGIKPRLHNDGKYHGTIRQRDIWSTLLHLQPQLARDNQLLNSSGVLPFNMFEKWQYCHCNYWIAKPHVFDDYCKNVLVPAMNFFESPHIMNSLPKWYTHKHEGRKTTSICFTFEGLFGSFVANSNYTFDYICKKKIHGRYKMVTVDGYEITN